MYLLYVVLKVKFINFIIVRSKSDKIKEIINY